LLVGTTGFVAGFYGPIALNPSANQGPLVGLFITGPGGFVLGLLFGLVVKLLPLSAATTWKALFGTCAVLASATLYFCLPKPEIVGDVIEARVQSCRTAANAMPDAIADWDKQIAHVTWAPPRAGWRASTASMLEDDPGVVLELRLDRTNTIYRQRKPWNRGRIIAGGWRPSQETRSFFARFAGSSCDAYPNGMSGTYFPQSEDKPALWPPTNLPTFLNKQALGEVPAEYSKLVSE
jgi:hypothetical protein